MREREPGNYSRNLTDRAIRIAQEIGVKEGIALGSSVVLNDGSRTVYRLESMDRDMARIVIPKEKSFNGEEVIKEVPVNTLADANLVYKIAQKLHLDQGLENPN